MLQLLGSQLKTFAGCSCWQMASVASGKTVVFSELKGLKAHWDNCVEVRERMRDFGRLVLEAPKPDEKPEVPSAAVAKTVENARFNSFALRPLLKMMSKCRNAVPCIDSLTAEVQDLHAAHKLNSSFKVVSDEAWSLRYTLGVVKNAMWRQKAPKAAWMHEMLACYLQLFIC